MSPSPDITAWQIRLLQEIASGWPAGQMSEPLKQAIINTPRHLFLEQYKLRNETTWHEVSDANLHEHLFRIYQDQPLALIHPPGGIVLSAQSKPSFIFSLVDRLEIGKGNNILEIGSGSGWLAAVMADLTGPFGKVFGVEILTDAVKLSRASLARANVANVHIVESDGMDGFKEAAPYDRVVITASTDTFPAWLFDQVRIGGRVMIPLVIPGGGDCMFLVERKADRFESLSSILSLSVPMGGRGTAKTRYLMDRPDAEQLRRRPITHLQWPANSFAGNDFLERTLECRFFLSITENDFVAYNIDPPGSPLRQTNLAFGIEDRNSGSIALATARGIVTFGTAEARRRLESAIVGWRQLRQNRVVNFDLSVYPGSSLINDSHNGWIRKSGPSTLLWKLAEGSITASGE